MIPGPVHRCPSCGAWTMSAQAKCRHCRTASQRAAREWEMAALRESVLISAARTTRQAV